MHKNIVAFVGENAYGILRELSLGCMRPAEAAGFKINVINLYDPGWKAQLGRLIDDGIFLAWGAAGIGSALQSDGRSLWEDLGVPFVSALADPPCMLPHAHCPKSRAVVLGYFFDEWLDIQRRFFQSPNICGRLPICIPPNPYRDEVPWLRRSHRMVFVKSSGSPQALHAKWAAWPADLRAAMEDVTAQACRQGTMGLTDLFLDCMAAHKINLEEHPDLKMGLMQELDTYVRWERATRMAQALSRLPAIIIGPGWDHIDRTGARAIFHPSIEARHLPDLMADTQFVINTTPNFGSGAHERVLAGFAARACVVSDDNAYSRKAFADIPTYFGLEWHTDDLADRLAEIWATDRDFGPATDVALHLAETTYSADNFVHDLLRLADLGRFALRSGRAAATI